jgi:dihydroxy-acid dehydratase
MGTASTMACVVAGLGMMPLKGASAPAVSSSRLRIAEETGGIAVKLAQSKTSPQTILTKESFLNAIIVLQAIGGSTNALVHLMAIANRHPETQGVITLQTFDEIGRNVPLVIDLKPSGDNYMTDFHNAGGMLALMHTLSPLLHLNAMTVTGDTIGEVLAKNPFRTFPFSKEVIRPLTNPIYPASSLVVLSGSMCPNGAVMKASASGDRRLMHHSGPAVVFRNSADMAARLDDPELDVTADSILVLQGIGPIGNPGMPEAGLIPIPRKLSSRGVKDMLRISDGRMSGTAGGSIILHVSPESVLDGSVFGIIQDGDIISFNLTNRSLNLDVGEEEIKRRLEAKKEVSKTQGGVMQERKTRRGYRGLYERCVLQAEDGADFDFLTASGVERS